MAAAIERRPGVVDVDALEGGREVVAVRLSPHLAVGDDVETRPLLGTDGQERGVILCLLEVLRLHPPQFPGAHPRREAAGQPGPVDEPVRLGIAAHQRGGQDRQRGRCRGHSGDCRAAAVGCGSRPRPSSVDGPGQPSPVGVGVWVMACCAPRSRVSAVLTSPTWLNACGVLPSCRRRGGSHSSLSRPTSLRRSSSRSKRSRASSWRRSGPGRRRARSCRRGTRPRSRAARRPCRGPRSGSASGPVPQDEPVLAQLALHGIDRAEDPRSSGAEGSPPAG